jgi:hypothetical protein
MMSLQSELEELFSNEDESIIQEPLRFKAKLGIGERAYALIRAREHMTTFTEALGIGAAASTAAGSTVVATTFFAKTGLVASALSSIGLGVTAVTPVGWILAAGVVSSAAYVGVSRFFERSKKSDLVIIPKYINTPMDIIALAMLELRLPFSIKLAHASGVFSDAKYRVIQSYYADQWGYSAAFVALMITEYQTDLESISFSRLAQTLTEYCEDNPDCDRAAILGDFVQHLADVIEADPQIHEQELLQFEYLKTLLQSEPNNSKLAAVMGAAKRGAATIASGAKFLVGKRRPDKTEQEDR